MNITFYGGTGVVTGSCYLLETTKLKVLIDCGLFQGDSFIEQKNFEKFPFDPAAIDYLFITHAHLDHVGRIPKLCKEGFKGKIISTLPTKDLARVILEDGLKNMIHAIERQEIDQMLYEEKDLAHAFSFWNHYEYNEEINLTPDTKVILRDSAHVLGSSLIEFYIDDKKIIFTGDLGNPPTPLLGNVYQPQQADYLIMESVYGDRVHQSHTERKTQLERVIEETAAKNGTIIIPAFAMERTQEILAELDELVHNKRIPPMPVFIDSPLAFNATEVYKKHERFFNASAQYQIKSGEDLFKFPGLKFTVSKDESIAINDIPSPKIIIAGNPHGYGSRIAHHFIRYLGHPENSVIFVGFQGISSLGDKISRGEKRVQILDKVVDIKARVVNLDGYSAHADQIGLEKFVRGIKKPIQKIFVVMGEEQSSQAISQIIMDQIGIPTVIPDFGDKYDL